MTRLDIATQIEGMSQVTSQRTLTNMAIQIALNRTVEYHEWPYYMQPGVINTVAPYETGTVTATNGSTAVTGSGTAWTSAMIGRKIRFANQMAYYRITAVGSTTTLTLEAPFQDTTTSAMAYSIYKDEYRLAPDVDTYKRVIQIQNGIAMASIPASKFDSYFPTPYSQAAPSIEIMSGTKLDIYTTGTVTGAAGAKVITGSSTAWTSVEGLGRMSNIIVGSNRYTVKSVDSATQITVYEALSSAFSATTYQINLNNLRLQVFSIPSSQQNLYYRYFRLPEVMANDYDVPDMPQQWQYLLIYGGLSFLYMQKGDINNAQNVAEARFLEGLGHMMKKLGSFSSDRIYRRQSQGRVTSMGEGLEKATFDRRYSGF